MVSGMIRKTAYRAGLAALAFCGLAACVMDKEPEVRSGMDRWVNLGETIYFESERKCTAAAFRVKETRVRSFITRARNIDRGLRLIADGQPVAFDLTGRSPTQISAALMEADMQQGLAILSSGIAARGCMTDEASVAYYKALQSPDAVLIFDPVAKALAVLDRQRRWVFYLRGRV
jgi:hypothetical protein